jgi:hypothetical protein
MGAFLEGGGYPLITPGLRLTVLPSAAAPEPLLVGIGLGWLLGKVPLPFLLSSGGVELVGAGVTEYGLASGLPPVCAVGE